MALGFPVAGPSRNAIRGMRSPTGPPPPPCRICLCSTDHLLSRRVTFGESHPRPARPTRPRSVCRAALRLQPLHLHLIVGRIGFHEKSIFRRVVIHYALLPRMARQVRRCVDIRRCSVNGGWVATRACGPNRCRRARGASGMGGCKRRCAVGTRWARDGHEMGTRSSWSNQIRVAIMGLRRPIYLVIAYALVAQLDRATVS